MPDERFVVQYQQKEAKCKRWKDFIDIKKSIVFCSALGGILGSFVGMPVGGAVFGGVMGTNAKDSLMSLVDYFVGPSEEDKKKYEFYKKYEDKYLSYTKEYADNNNQKVDFDKSHGPLLSHIQKEIETCYNNLNKDETDGDFDKIIDENIKKQHKAFKNLSDRNLFSRISETCKDVVKKIGNFCFNTDKGKVVKRLEEIVPDKHISTYMDKKDKKIMFNLYEKIRSHQEIKINFVDKCSQEQSNENSNFNSDTLYLSREIFEKVYKVFTETKFEKEKMPTQTHLNLFTQTYTLLFGEFWNKSFLKAFNGPDFSREKDIFSLEKIPQMKWKVKKRIVDGKSCTTKTLEYFFADISNYIQDHKYQGLKGSIEPSMKNNDAIILSAKYSNLINKKSHNLSSRFSSQFSSPSTLTDV